MKRAIALMVGSVLAGACDAPSRAPDWEWDETGSSSGSGAESWDDRASWNGDTGAGTFDDAQLFFLAYQATGERDGEPVALTHVLANSGLEQPGIEEIELGDCVGRRVSSLEAGSADAYLATDFGPIELEGARDPFRCEWANGTYRCDLARDATFFDSGALLGLRFLGDATHPSFAITDIETPRAPAPELDVNALWRGGEDLRVTWTPSTKGRAEMTCLQLDALDEQGEVVGHIQCDADDADGEVVVPGPVMMMLDGRTPTPVVRAALFSVNGSSTWYQGRWTGAYFGQGRFVEHTRPAAKP